MHGYGYFSSRLHDLAKLVYPQCSRATTYTKLYHGLILFCFLFRVADFMEACMNFWLQIFHHFRQMKYSSYKCCSEKLVHTIIPYLYLKCFSFLRFVELSTSLSKLYSVCVCLFALVMHFNSKNMKSKMYIMCQLCKFSFYSTLIFLQDLQSGFLYWLKSCFYFIFFYLPWFWFSTVFFGTGIKKHSIWLCYLLED